MHVGRQYRHKQTWLPLALAPNLRDEERVGEHGLKADAAERFKWAKRAADLDHPPAIDDMGFCFLSGRGVATNIPHGHMLMSQAAALGVDHACWFLAAQYAHSKYSFSLIPKDLERAQHWAKKAADAGNVKHRFMTDSQRAEVSRWAEGNFEAAAQ